MMNAVIYSYAGNGDTSDEEQKEATPANPKSESEKDPKQEKLEQKAKNMGIKLEESSSSDDEPQGNSVLRGAFQLDPAKAVKKTEAQNSEKLRPPESGHEPGHYPSEGTRRASVTKRPSSSNRGSKQKMKTAKTTVLPPGDKQ